MTDESGGFFFAISLKFVMPFQYECCNSLLITVALRFTFNLTLIGSMFEPKAGDWTVAPRVCLGGPDRDVNGKVPKNIIVSIENNDYQAPRNDVSYAQFIINGT